MTDSPKPHKITDAPQGGIEIKDIFLAESAFDKKKFDPAGKLQMEFEILNEFEDNSSINTCFLSVSIKTGKITPFLEVTFGGNFDVQNDSIPINYIREVHFPAYIYPFIREYIVNTSLKALLPPIYLPTINFARMHELGK